MTLYPRYLIEYPNMDHLFPIHISVHNIKRKFPSHRHDFLEFSYVFEGSGYELINGVRHEMKPGTFTLVMPYQVHEIYVERSPLRLYNCNFEISLLQGTAIESGIKNILLETGSTLPSYAYLDEPAHQAMMHILQALESEYHGDGKWKYSLLRAKLTEALVIFDRSRPTLSAVSSKNSKMSSNKYIWDILQYIYSHYHNGISLSAVAKHFQFSSSHLSELFYEATGVHFVHFVREIRLRHATGLLISTDMSVVDISVEVGFGSYKTFARSFRNELGTTPQEYRKKNALLV